MQIEAKFVSPKSARSPTPTRAAARPPTLSPSSTRFPAAATFRECQNRHLIHKSAQPRTPISLRATMSPKSARKSPIKTPSRTKILSRTTIPSRNKARSRIKIRSRITALSRSKVRSQTKTRSRSKVQNRTKIRSQTKTPSRNKARSQIKTRSRSKARSRTKIQSRITAPSRTKIRSRTTAPSTNTARRINDKAETREGAQVLKIKARTVGAARARLTRSERHRTNRHRLNRHHAKVLPNQPKLKSRSNGVF